MPVIILALLLTSVLAYSPSSLGLNHSETLYASTVFDKNSIMSVNIIMDEEDWDDMLENAMSEEYYSCDVEINGTKYCNVGIRPKGNTSLSQIVSDDTTDRYSFKLEFDHYKEGQSLDGLDKLALNNMMSDATYMKEYISYDILTYMGVNSSLYSYAEVNVNGTYWGLYFAIEAVEESFLQRNYGTTDGELYKPETMGGGEMPEGMEFPQGERPEMPADSESQEDTTEGNGMPQGKPPAMQGGNQTQEGTAEGNEMPQGEPPAMQGGNQTQEGVAEGNGMPQGEPPAMQEGNQTQEGNEMPQGEPPAMQGENQIREGTTAESNTQDTEVQEKQNEQAETSETTDDTKAQGMERGQGGKGGFGGGGMGSDLSYTDDDLDSYSVIWENSVMGSVSDSDKERVVEALKNITNQENVEDYLDVDQMLRYIAANVVLLNDDSYFGNMLHNYYLYENDGKLSMIPWDYNLAFGGFAKGSGDATDLVNRAIDDVVSSGSLEERPMLAAALSSEAYYDQYHEYLQQLVEGYFESGLFETTVNQLKKMIAPYVETDPTAFYTYDEFEAGVETLLSFVKARFESIKAQLEGEIPATAAERTGEGYTLVDGSSITVSTMGTQGGKDMEGFQPFDFNTGEKNTALNEQTQSAENAEEPTSTESVKEDAAIQSDKQMGPPNEENEAVKQGMQLPDEMMPKGDVTSNKTSKTETIIITGVSFGVLLAAILFVKIYKRRKYRAK